MTVLARSPLPPTGVEHDAQVLLPDGRTVSWTVLGAEDATPSVIVLDGPGSRGLARALSGAARDAGVALLAPDRPGAFASSPAPGATVASWPADLAAVLDHVGVARAGVVAQSGGTPFALAAAAVLGDRVGALAFCGPLAPLDERGAMRGVRGPLRVALPLARRAPWLLRRMLGAASKQAARDVEAAADKAAKDLPPADAALMEDPDWRAVHVRATGEILARPDALCAEMRLIARPWRVDLTAIHAPAAIWVGEQDTTHPPTMAHRLAALLGDAPVTIVPDAATFGLAPCYPDVLRAATGAPALG